MEPSEDSHGSPDQEAESQRAHSIRDALLSSDVDWVYFAVHGVVIPRIQLQKKTYVLFNNPPSPPSKPKDNSSFE